jgi:hypothetical protein
LERADSWERKALPTPPAPANLSIGHGNKKIAHAPITAMNT